MLRFRPISAGYYIITAEINNRILATTTTNSMAIDAAFDDTYDLYHNEDKFYETQEQAKQTLINQIIRDNDECI